MSKLNRLATRKEIGAIRYRLTQADLSADLRRRIIARHIGNLSDTLPDELIGIVPLLWDANEIGNLEDLVVGLNMLNLLVPATYGSIPAGTVFRFNGEFVTKRKDGIETPRGKIPHIDAGYRIQTLNGE